MLSIYKLKFVAVSIIEITVFNPIALLPPSLRPPPPFQGQASATFRPEGEKKCFPSQVTVGNSLFVIVNFISWHKFLRYRSVRHLYTHSLTLPHSFIREKSVRYFLQTFNERRNKDGKIQSYNQGRIHSYY